MATIGEVVRSRRFIQHSLLIGLTAALTGVLIPLVDYQLARQRIHEEEALAAQRFRDQRIFEAELARQQKLIDAQSELLDEAGEMFGDFLMDAYAVYWYQTDETAADPERFRDAAAHFDSSGWSFHSAASQLLRRAGRLSPPDVHSALSNAYSRATALDGQLIKLIRQTAPDSSWQMFGDSLHATSSIVESALDTMATRFGLTYEPPADERVDGE